MPTTDTNARPGHKWTADRPLEQLKDDKLVRDKFADRIAREIRAWHHEKESLVISLNGDWGSGKTSFKNFVLRCMEQQADAARKPRIAVVEFNPWQWSAQDRVLEGFFDEVSRAFRRRNIGSWLVALSLSRSWKALRVLTLASGDLASRLLPSMGTLSALIVAGASGLLANASSNPTIKAVLERAGVVLLLVAAACALFAPISEFLAGLFGWKREPGKESLDAVRKRLRGKLANLSAPILVVIDDIDRLTQDEVRLVMQLVKANADFPNVAYLLLFDRSVVAKALKDVAIEDGHEFLRKIVQIELEVPAPPDYKLRDMLGSGLSRIHGRAEFRWDPESKERWRKLFEDAIWPFFETPRDVKRFLSVFEFYFEGHVVDGQLDVNFTDLVLLETIRMFDPVAYEEVGRGFQKRRNVVLELLFDRKETQQQFALGIKRLVDERGLSEPQKSRLRALLFGLFPQAHENSSPRDREWDRDSRICHARHFPKYFQLVPDPGDVSSATIAELIKASGDRVKCCAILRKAADDDVFMRLLERLRTVVDELSAESIETIFAAALDISDDLPVIKGGLDFEGDGERELASFCVDLLGQVPDVVSRGEILRRAITSTVAVTAPVQCVSRLEPEQAVGDAATEAHEAVPVTVLNGLKDLLRPRLWEVAKSGRIWDLRMLSYLLYRLRDWAGEQPVKLWLSEEIKNPERATKFALQMLQVSSASGSHSGYRKIFKLYGDLWEGFVDLGELHESIKNATGGELLRYTVSALGKIVDAKRRGEPLRRIYVVSQDAEGKWMTNESDKRL